MSAIALLAIGLTAFAIGVLSGHGGASAAPGHGGAAAPEREKHADVIADAELVGPNEAWAATSQRLALTVDAGRHWKTITPEGVQAESIRAIYFSDSTHGWIAVSPDPYAIHPELSVLSTSDGGATWSSSEITDPDLLTIARVRITFVGNHGWVSVNEQSPGGSNAISHLYSSADSGKSWSTLPRPPAPGELKFTSDTEGWLAGGVGTQTLWRSLNGGQSWSPVRLELPAGVEEPMVSYGTPEISESGPSLLPVTFSKPEYETEVGVYASSDGGDSWTLGSVVPVAGATEPGLPVETSFPDPDTVAIVNPESSTLSIVADEPPGGSGEGARSPGSPMSRRVVNTEGLPSSALVDFSGAQDALALVNSASCPGCSEEGVLLFTGDGGRSWKPSPSRP
ncbi:MAG TPA: hypothetical protein VLK37_07210 [Solirubrobacterales bacterium]|nr:hypothetical protein [Solirubrobacterales bacterium]